MDQWVSESLSRILDFEVPDDLIKYILSIDNETDLKEYIKTLIDFNNSQHKNFFSELCKRKFPSKGGSVSKQQKKKISKNKQQQEFINADTPPEKPVQPVEDSKAKKKTKYVNLYSQEGKNAQVVLLKGRHHCDCQASKHELINNCIQCGRVICKQEGSGPCLFCGNLVCTPEEQREINTKTKGGAKLMESLMERSRPKGWEAAMSHRNRLLEYDRTSERRTRVTDDDSDYFQANSVWLSATEKDKLDKYQQSLHDKKHASRRDKKMTFDFAGRQIVEDNTIDYEPDEDKIRQMADSGTSSYRQHDMLVGVPSDRDVAPGVNAPMLQFDPSVGGLCVVSEARAGPGAFAPRVQDAELQEMSDTGRCLSMHQPWASLLVEGIKLHSDSDSTPLPLLAKGANDHRGLMVDYHRPPHAQGAAPHLINVTCEDSHSVKVSRRAYYRNDPMKHEGRTWYTSHRGRLWIASTAKPPDQDVIRALENQYRVLYPEKQLQFPSFYPTGCLLGCVHVDDCLPQEEYQKKYPDGESDSPYVFICSNPMSLRLRFPIKGQHKIYALEKTIHQAAVKCMQKMSKVHSEEAHAA